MTIYRSACMPHGVCACRCLCASFCDSRPEIEASLKTEHQVLENRRSFFFGGGGRLRATPLRNMRTDFLLMHTCRDTRALRLATNYTTTSFRCSSAAASRVLCWSDALPPGSSPWPALAASPFFRIERLPRARVCTSQPAAACFFFPS